MTATTTAASTVIPPATPDPNATPAPAIPPAEPENDRVKRDMLKYKNENEQLRQENESLKVKTHKEKEDWKGLAEHHEAKSKEFETKYVGLQGSLVNEKKYSALKSEAIKQGMNPASLPDLELLDFEEVTIETTSTGKILVSGQDRAIAKLKVIRPHWFSNTVPSVNPSTPTTFLPNNEVVTLADLNAAEAQYNKTKSDSDKKKYSEMIQKYKAQPKG